MVKRTPVIRDNTGYIRPAGAQDTLDPARILSQDAGQQLAEGDDGGILAKGLALKSDLDSLSGLVHGVSQRLDAHAFGFDVFSPDPGTRAAQEAALTAYAVGQIPGTTGVLDLPAHLSVRNLHGNHLFRLNPGSPPSWVDDGFDIVAKATNTSLGLIMGKETGDGYGNVQADGTMKVNGLADLIVTVDGLVEDVEGITGPSGGSLSLKEDKGNKVTTISAASTDVQYPSAKAVQGALTDLQASVEETVEEAVAASGVKAVLVSAPDTRSSDLAKNANFTVPEYKVGADQLLVYWNGLHCAKVLNYAEVGATGAKSTTIKILHPLSKADAYVVYVL
ncbi:MAG: hypothetical protein LBL95_09480 [Deltaproteobacteria bacterium]|jgi:hypothetical protein|nr:hypothetical protein [Deltaproteobacteria bacterium]